MPWKKNGITKICEACGSSYYVSAYRVESARFCSTGCQNHLQYKGRTFPCGGCNKEIRASESRARKKFCSLACRSKIAQTTKERRRKQKISTIKSRGYSTTGRRLKKLLFSIGRRRCEVCGFDENDYCLDVHHKDENPDNNHLNNLALLCVMCHRKHHKEELEYASSERYLKRNHG